MRTSTTLFSVILSACVSKDTTSATAGIQTESSEPSTTNGGMATTNASTSTAATTSSSTTAVGSEASVSGTSDTGDADLGQGIGCDLAMQDCPDGLKCVPFSSAGGSLDSTHCMPQVDQPNLPGEACSIISGDYTDQQDTCAAGSFCWFVDFQGSGGTCVAFCGLSEGQYDCKDPSTHCSVLTQGEYLNLCVPNCDPLQPVCPEGGICAAGAGTFECKQMLDTAEEEYGEPCNGLWDCAPGFACSYSGDVAGCEEPCCTAYCDINAPNTCPSAPAEVCVSILGEMNVEWGHIGECVVP